MCRQSLMATARRAWRHSFYLAFHFFVSCPHAAGILARLGAHRVGRKAIGKDNGGTTLVLPDVPASGQGLLEGDPTLGRVGMLCNGTSQDQDVDPGIAAPG